MSPSDPNSTPELLLEQAAWIRRLARSLVGDAQAADDLAQETWVRALEHPPEPDRPLRGWLATVMRNLARQTRRGERRRRERETGAARDERDDAVRPDAVLERATTHRALVDEVLALDEPYRGTLLLRYFDGLAPTEIARRTGDPLPTVKSRLARGLDALRARLDRRADGDRDAWVAALAPLAALPPAPVAPMSAASTPTSPVPHVPLASLGAAVMNVKLAVFLFVSVAAGVAYLAVRSPEAVEPVEAARLAEPAHAVELAGALAAPEPGPTRVVVAEASEPAAEPRETAHAPATPAGHAADTTATFEGRVIDVHSLPVGGVYLQQVTELYDERSRPIDRLHVQAGQLVEADGTFRIESAGGGRLVVSDERYCTVLAGTPVPRGSVVVVAPRVELAGRVVDDAGTPIEGVRVRVEPPEDLRAELDAVLDHSLDQTFEATSDTDGRFAFREAPALDGARLRAGKEGFLGVDEPAPRSTLLDLVLVLERRTDAARLLRGRVVDADGRPVPGARVAHGMDVATSDEHGRFVFDLGAEQTFNARWNEMAARHLGEDAVQPTPDVLTALKAGYLPGETRTGARDEAGEPEWPAEVTIRLAGTPLAIEGRVVDVDGHPRENAQVWLADPTFFGGLGDPAAGEGPNLAHTEALLAGSEDSWHKVTTDAEGRFRLEGLLEREYAVEAMDPFTLLRTKLEGVDAGAAHVELVLPTDRLYPVLRGTVVSRGGRPVEGVRVHPMNDAFRYRRAGHTMGTRHAVPPTKRALTDEDGRFELTEVPRRLTYLRLDGETTLPLEWGRHVEGGLEELLADRDAADWDDVTIVVSVRCHFQVDAAGAFGDAPPDELALLDAEGNELEISEFVGHGRRENVRQPLVDGRSATLAAGDEAATLVLYRGGVELERLAVELRPDEKTTIRP